MRMFSVLLAVSCLLSAAVAVQPSFDAREVVRQVRDVVRPASGVESVAFDDGEFLVDTSSTPGPSPGEQESPAIAFDGTNFLVVWQDYRVESSYDIYGARVTPAGVVLDPNGIIIAQAAGDQCTPVLAFGGVSFLVVWADERREDDGDIYGARVMPSGTVLDPDGLAISCGAGPQWFPALAFDGANFLAAWVDGRNGISDIYGARVAPDGAVLDPDGFIISHAANGQSDPALAFDGANYLAAWADERDSGDSHIYGARVTPSGAVLDTQGIAISLAHGGQYYPAVCPVGTNSLVVWEDGRGGHNDIYGARVTPQGTVLDPAGLAVSMAEDDQWDPAVVSDGTNALVVWGDYRNGDGSDIYGARVTPQGTVLDPEGFVISQDISSQRSPPAIAFGGANSFVIWTAERDRSYFDIYGARVTPSGTVLDTAGLAVSEAASRQESPALAFDGTNFLAVWADERDSGDSHVYGARVAPTGVVLDTAAIAISTGWTDQGLPALAFDGTDFLVVWHVYRGGAGHDIYGARVTPGGVVLDTSGIAISTAADDQGAPAVAFDGTNFLVTWGDCRRGIGSADIYGARVTPAGATLDTSGIAISTAAHDQWAPAVAFDGTNFLVTWEDYRSGGHPDIYGARVSPAGTVLDPEGMVISQAAESQHSPALAFDGTNSFVTWEDRRNVSCDIYGARVTPSGTVLDTSGIPVSTAAGGQYDPVVASDGTNSLVAWSDGRSEGFDIYGAWVTPTGSVIGEGAVVWQGADQSRPALSRGAGGQLALAYHGWAGTVGGKVYNTYRIWGKMNPVPGVEESRKPQAANSKLTASVVRGVLHLGTRARSVLLDASGRRVMDLVPGANDVSRLPSGVYFVRQGQGGHNRNCVPVPVHKVVIQR